MQRACSCRHQKDFYQGWILTITQLIRRLRAIPMTQAEIARRTGIPQATISRWEGGATTKAADAAIKLSQLLADVEPYRAKPGQHPGNRRVAPVAIGTRKVPPLNAEVGDKKARR